MRNPDSKQERNSSHLLSDAKLASAVRGMMWIKQTKKAFFLLVIVLVLIITMINLGMPRAFADAAVGKYVTRSYKNGDLIFTGETWQDAPLNYRKSFNYQYMAENGGIVSIKAYPGYFPIFVSVDSRNEIPE